MTTCKRCGKENQDHYKFCLGCGGEIAAAPAALGAAMAKTVMADPPAKKSAAPTPPAGVAALGATAPSTVAAAASRPHVAAVPTPSNPAMSKPKMQGLPSALSVATAPPSAAPANLLQETSGPAAGARACPNCGFEVPAAFAFCGACGSKLAPVKPAVAVVPRIPSRLTLVRPDGTEGGAYDLVDGDNTIGRTLGSFFETDGYLSPQHACLSIKPDGVVIRDLGSLNGVFVRLTEEEEIVPGDVFRVGQELLRFDTITPGAQLKDGTEILGSPNPGYWGRLSAIIGLGLDGAAYPLCGDTVTLGRERGDINFPDDGYVSGLHARFSMRGGKYYLADLGSSNGTFLRIRGERSLPNSSILLLGQQLFRFTA